MWEDGALFQEVMNQEMTEQFPEGIDPTHTNDPIPPVQLLLNTMNATSNSSVGNDGNALVDTSLQKATFAADKSLSAEEK